MKKYFIICLYILIIFTQLQAQELEKWIKKPIADKWGDTTGYMYAQTQVGTDSKNKYVCAFGFCCETEYEDISLKICSSIVTKFATWHPGRDYYSSNIYIKLREGEQIKTFIGTTSPAESTYDFLTIDMNKSDAIKIAKLLKENKTWDVLIEGNNWFNKTTITGNLPFNFDEENVIVISKDKKNVKGIKSWAKSTIKNINIPDGIEKIENSAFSNCTKLESITFPNSLKEIGSSFSIREGAFAGCKKLTKIFLPYSLTKIYSGTFSNCTSLESINFSNDSIEIEYGAFDNCKSLQRINLKIM